MQTENSRSRRLSLRARGGRSNRGRECLTRLRPIHQARPLWSFETARWIKKASLTTPNVMAPGPVAYVQTAWYGR